MRDDNLNIPRIIGLIAAVAVIFGGGILTLTRFGRPTAIGPGWATFFLCLGLTGLLFHAAMDRDIQFRRLYMFFGYAGLLMGFFLALLPYEQVGALFQAGFVVGSVALLFLLAFLRNETEDQVRNVAVLVLAGVGTTLALVAFLGSNIKADFLVPKGLQMALLAIVFFVAAVSARGIGDDRTYYAALTIGLVGLIILAIALLRSVSVAFSARSAVSYFYPTGMLLSALGIVYIVTSAFLCSDNRIVVMARRELGSFFYSPIAYFLLIAFVAANWFVYANFLFRLFPLFDVGTRQFVPRPVPEPIVAGYINWLIYFSVMFIVPALTMRLLSEEKRTGTLEVLLTTPVEEIQLVLAKFLASMILFFVFWIPSGLLLIATAQFSEKGFDYQPLLGFGVVLIITACNFLSMGLFFSSLSNNQIVSAVLTFAGMVALTMVGIGAYMLEDSGFEPNSALVVIFRHMSYLDLWGETLRGKMVPKYLLFHLSMTVLWLFGTVKVLEARKWS